MPTTDQPRTAKARWILEEWESEGGTDDTMREALIEVERQASEGAAPRAEGHEGYIDEFGDERQATASSAPQALDVDALDGELRTLFLRGYHMGRASVLDVPPAYRTAIKALAYPCREPIHQQAAQAVAALAPSEPTETGETDQP